ncbi:MULTISPECIES: DUF6092 family protein [Streptomyces]|uniref:DUF6092 family protein n=1 Tax=Streptomyces TaxID=1883 RepID=UPI00068C527D|nr:MULTISPECIES: DUF6092 family protein [Streptomyces]QHF95124.1 hypothetical protein DEH18_16080 [Streptomyces sp. NHF165]
MEHTDRQLPVRLREDLVLLTAYLLSTGHGLLHEPAAYAPARAVDAARRTLGLLAEHDGPDRRLDEVRARIDEFFTDPHDGEPLAELLDELCVRMAEVVDAFQEDASPAETQPR